MLRPDWKKAPDWANYAAMDASGSWYWYESKPYLFSVTWQTDEGFESSLISTDALVRDDSLNLVWRETLHTLEGWGNLPRTPHWHSAAFLGYSLEYGKTTQASTLFSTPTRNVTRAHLDKAAKEAGVRKDPVILNVSYLGEMTDEEFNGTKPTNTQQAPEPTPDDDESIIV